MPTEPGAQKAPQKNYVDTKIIATLFGLTARRIQQLTQDGVLKTEQVGRQRRYDQNSRYRVSRVSQIGYCHRRIYPCHCPKFADPRLQHQVLHISPYRNGYYQRQSFKFRRFQR